MAVANKETQKIVRMLPYVKGFVGDGLEVGGNVLSVSGDGQYKLVRIGCNLEPGICRAMGSEGKCGAENLKVPTGFPRITEFPGAVICEKSPRGLEILNSVKPQ